MQKTTMKKVYGTTELGFSEYNKSKQINKQNPGKKTNHSEDALHSSSLLEFPPVTLTAGRP